MKKTTNLFLLLCLSGCTHIGISDTSLLSTPEAKAPREVLRDFPLNIDADVECSTHTVGATMGGVLMKTYCSNKGRFFAIDEVFRERSLNVIPVKDPSKPQMSIRTDKFSDFLESTTGFFNLMTFGVVPLYNHTDYTVVYKSPKDNIDISKTVRISSTTSWFSLLLSNPENLSESEIERRAEKNMIRAVLEEANL